MKKTCFSIIFSLLVISASAQVNPSQETIPSLSISLETSLNDLIIGGFSTRFFVNTSRHWSIGVGIGNTPIEGVAKELVFDIDGEEDAITTDLPFIAGIQIRYFLAPAQSKFYTELSVGNEIFRVESGGEQHTNPNQFVVVSIGYLWTLKRGSASGFYINPRVGANFVWNDGGPRTINGLSYQLRPLFPNPGLQIGWRF